MGWKTNFCKYRPESGMKIGFWNKGGALQPLREKINEIEELMKRNQFCIFGVIEANFFADSLVEDVTISGYSILWDLGRENLERRNSRCVLFIRNDISFKIRKDIMDVNVPEIWVEAGQSNKKRFVLCL